MENDNIFDADYYIYVFHNRIVRIVRSRTAYHTVKLTNVNSYVVNSLPNDLSINDLLYKYNFSIGEKKGFYLPNEKELTQEQLLIMRKMTDKIILLEKFEKTVDMLKRTVIRRTSEDDVYNRILMQEIDQYQNKNITGSLLEAEFECSKFTSYDSLIESIKLQYSDASELFAFIKYKSFEFRKLLNEDKLQEGYEIILLMNQKLGM